MRLLTAKNDSSAPLLVLRLELSQNGIDAVELSGRRNLTRATARRIEENQRESKRIEAHNDNESRRLEDQVSKYSARENRLLQVVFWLDD